MFEIDEIEEVEINDSNTSNAGYIYTSEEIWEMGINALMALNNDT